MFVEGGGIIGWVVEEGVIIWLVVDRMFIIDISVFFIFCYEYVCLDICGVFFLLIFYFEV